MNDYADHAAVAKYVSRFTDVVTAGNDSPQEVYNADETSLNIRELSKPSLQKNQGSTSSFKMSKERGTVLACSNAVETYKLPLIVTSKLAKHGTSKSLCQCRPTTRAKEEHG